MKPSIAIVGPGRVGSALAKQLRQAGYRIDEIVGRSHSSMRQARRLAREVQAHASVIDYAGLTANVVWFCVPDSEIARAATILGNHSWKGKAAFHASGVLSSEALRDLSDQGADVASVHPLMTFIPGRVPEFRGAIFAIEGSPRALQVAREIVGRLRGVPLKLRSEQKPAYHAFATLICPLLVSLLAGAEKLAATIGSSTKTARKGMLPIIRQTLENYERVGPAAAFTGPIARGDIRTIQKHLSALQENSIATGVYVALVRAALKNLPAKNARTISSLLDQVSPGRTRRNQTRTGRASRPATEQS